MAFFYNLLITVAFVVCSLLFYLLWRQAGHPAHLWVAVTFALFTLDNLLLYMTELMPGFEAFHQGNQGIYAVASNLAGIAITFAYERVYTYAPRREGRPVCVPLWIAAAVAYVTLGFLWRWPLARVAILALRGLLPVVVILHALRACRPYDDDLPFPLWAGVAFLVLQAANSLEMVLAFLGLRLMGGRLVTVELLSVACVVAGVAYAAPRLSMRSADPVKVADPMKAANHTKTAGAASSTSPANAAGAPGCDGVLRVSEQFGLTDREREILALVYEGCSNHAIAERAFISEGTVKTHVHNIFQKTGCSSRTQLLRLVADSSR